MGSMLKEGLGIDSMWGFTPARDLLADIPKSVVDNTASATILIVQPGDPGHTLHTICSKTNHTSIKNLNIYIWASPIEVIARTLLLMQVVHDTEVPIRQRAALFLEIFGNCMLQERTYNYVAQMGKQLVLLLRESKGVLSNLIDLTHLKYKERDELEEVFVSWTSTAQVDMPQLRDQRMRNFFGLQYDARESNVDWDYNMYLKEVAGIVHIKQYRTWRTTGIAFEFSNQLYNFPNLSMLTYAEGFIKTGEYRGHKKKVRGFWLDIRVGPFIPFGIDCPKPNKAAEDLFLIHNKGLGTEQYRHNCAEVAVYNVINYMYQLETGSSYEMKKPHDVYSGLGDDLSDSVCTIEEVLEDNEANEIAFDGQTNNNGSIMAKATKILHSLQGISIVFLSGELSSHLYRKRYSKMFNHVHITGVAAQLSGEADLNKILAPEAIITVDTAKYMIPLKKTAQQTWISKIDEMAEKQGWTKELNQGSGVEADFLKFRYS